MELFDNYDLFILYTTLWICIGFTLSRMWSTEIKVLRVCTDTRYTFGCTCRLGSDYTFGTLEITPSFRGVRVAIFSILYVLFCVLLYVYLSFSFWTIALLYNFELWVGCLSGIKYLRVLSNVYCVPFLWYRCIENCWF